MLIRDKKSFGKGALLLASFMCVFTVMLMPIFPGSTSTKVSGLDYADDLFNKLSKGSSYFIPMVQERVAKLESKEYTLSVVLKKESLMPIVVNIIQQAGGKAEAQGKNLTYTVNLQALLQKAVLVSDLMYNNNGEAVSKEYQNAAALKVSEAWWVLLSPSVKALQKQGAVAQASVVDAVLRRGIETGHNFYSVTATKVKDNILITVALLAFYVIYTMWYGFAIFDLFDGVGLTMKKSKAQK